MKVTIKKNDILDVLSKVQGITNRKSNLAITETILIQSNDSGITISATDFETGFEGSYPAEIESGGVITINSRKLYEIVRSFPDDEIHINEIENRRLKIGNNNIDYNLVGMNPDDFPEIPKVTGGEFFVVNSGQFKKMIEQTVVIHSPAEEKRAHILGVNFECVAGAKTNTIRMVSTDGKRLIKTDYVYEDKEIGLAPGSSVIVPKKGLSDVGKFLESEGTVAVGVKDNHFIVQKEGETIIVSLLEGEFPKFDDIISNRENDQKIEFNRDSLRDMLIRMSILTSDEYRGVYFYFKEDQLEIKTANPNIGESKEDLSIKFGKKPIKVVFNPQFFIDTLNFIESETVLLNLIDAEHPCLIHGEANRDFLSVIMPMRYDE
jgi:DNA polymerase-3 subunit beta